MLTIDDLMKELDKYPRDTPVFVDGYENGYEPVLKKNITTVTVVRDKTVHDEGYWKGKYEEKEFLMSWEIEPNSEISVVLLSRYLGSA